MEKYIAPIQITLSVMLVGLILLQQRGVGLSGAFGGGGEFYSTRRGIERILFILTVIVAILFIATSIFSLFV